MKKPCQRSLRGRVVIPPYVGSCYGTHTPGMDYLQVENPAGTVSRDGRDFPVSNPERILVGFRTVER